MSEEKLGYITQDRDKALEEVMPDNLSQFEKAAYFFGFNDGWKAGIKHQQQKLNAYEDYVSGKITLAELEKALQLPS